MEGAARSLKEEGEAMSTRPTAVLLAVVCISAAVVTPAAPAAPPGSGSGTGTGTACSGPTLLGPTSAHVGQTYTVTGCGFAANTILNIEITEANGCCMVQQVYTDTAGRFELTSDVWAAGYYRMRASIYKKRGWVLAATWSMQAT